MSNAARNWIETPDAWKRRVELCALVFLGRGWVPGSNDPAIGVDCVGLCLGMAGMLKAMNPNLVQPIRWDATRRPSDELLASLTDRMRILGGRCVYDGVQTGDTVLTIDTAKRPHFGIASDRPWQWWHIHNRGTRVASSMIDREHIRHVIRLEEAPHGH